MKTKIKTKKPSLAFILEADIGDEDGGGYLTVKKFASLEEAEAEAKKLKQYFGKKVRKVPQSIFLDDMGDDMEEIQELSFKGVRISKGHTELKSYY